MHPLTVSLGRKRNLFIRVELREDDGDLRKQPLEVMFFILFFGLVIMPYFLNSDLDSCV